MFGIVARLGLQILILKMPLELRLENAHLYEYSHLN